MYSIVFQCLTIARVASLAEVLARDAVRKKTCIRCEMTEARVRDQDPAPSLPDPVPKTTGVGTPLSLIPYMYFPLRGPCILQILTLLRDFRVSHTHDYIQT